MVIPGATNTYVRQLFLDGTPLLNNLFVISGDQKTHLLRVLLGDHSGSVSGTVHCLSPSRPSGVVLQDVKSNDIWSENTDDRDRYVISGLPPGEYRLYAWSSLNNIEFRNPEFLARFAKAATTINLREGENITQLELNVLPDDY